MAFLRKKTIKGKQYYYLVKSVRINGKVQQKVVKYIGTHKNLTQAIKYLEDEQHE